jgi:hypothetical protein
MGSKSARSYPPHLGFASEKTCPAAGRGVSFTLNSFLYAVILFLAGCAAVPGRIQESISPFDGAKEIAMEPALVCREDAPKPCYIRLGLFKRSTMSAESVMLLAVVDGTNPIAEGKSLHFDMDGDIASFASIDRKTGYNIGKGPHTTGTAFCKPRANCSVKRYIVDKSFLKQLISARRAAVRISLKKGYVQGQLLNDSETMALPSFRQFYNRVFGPVE